MTCDPACAPWNTPEHTPACADRAAAAPLPTRPKSAGRCSGFRRDMHVTRGVVVDHYCTPCTILANGSTETAELGAAVFLTDDERALAAVGRRPW